MYKELNTVHILGLQSLFANVIKKNSEHNIWIGISCLLLVTLIMNVRENHKHYSIEYFHYSM